MKNFLHLIFAFLILFPQLIEAQSINVDLQNATYDDVNHQICFDVYMGQGAGYPGGWIAMNLRYDLDMVIASGTPTLGAPVFSNVNATYIDNPPAGSGTQPGSPPAGYEFEYGFAVSRLGGQVELPLSLTLMFSVCIPVINGTLDGSDPGNDIQMRAAATITGSSWSGANTTGRQPFSPVDAQEPLPIELLTFEVITNQCNAFLYWETATEQNLGYFQIETSRDGRSFEPIGQVKPKSPNSSSLRVYKFPIERELQNHYFRLKAVDLDEKFEYSPVVFAKAPCEEKRYDLQLYPNPNFTSELMVEVNSPDIKENVEVLLLDAFGKSMRRQKIDLIEIGSNKIPIETADLPTGTYFIKIIGIDQLNEPLKFIRSNF